MLSVTWRWEVDPCWWIENVLGVQLYAHQQDLINRTLAMYRHQDPELRRNQACWCSCNSAAKTHTLAAFSIGWLYNEFNSKVLQTAPTASQLTQVLWAEMRSMLAKAKLPLGGDLLPKANELIIDSDWYMIGINAAVYEAFQGRKSRRLLIVVDEGSGCKDQMFEAMAGNMATGDPLMLVASNGTRATGKVHQALHGGRANWHTERIDAFDLPNLAPLKQEFDDPKTSYERKLQMLRTAPLVAEHLANGRWAAGILAEFGEESDMFRVRVRGLFPKGDPNQLITLGDVVDARARSRDIAHMNLSMAELAAKQGKPFPWWRFRELLADKVFGGLDVARFGDCSSVLAAQSQLIWAPLTTWPPQSTTQLQGFVADEIERLGIHQTNVDEPGVGGGPVDNLTWMATGIVPFNGGKQAWIPSRFPNLRSEQFWALRQLLRQGRPYLPDNDRLEGQLTAIRYSYLPKGEKRVETKDEMAGRGIHFMDEADAVMMSSAQVPGADAVRTGRNTLASAALMEDDEEKW